MDLQRRFQYQIFLSFLIVLASINTAWAAIYRYTSKDGSVVFSDKPHAGAEKVALPPTTIIPSTPNTSSSTTYSTPPTTRENSNTTYQVTITSPQPNQTFVRGTDPVSFNVQTDKALQNADRLYLYMNGNLIGEGYTTPIDTTNLDRGEYSLTAKVVNANNQPVSNEAKSSFYVYQRSVLNGKKGR